MRFMVLIEADRNTEAGVMPNEELLTEMGRFNEELVNISTQERTGVEMPKPTLSQSRAAFALPPRAPRTGARRLPPMRRRWPTAPPRLTATPTL